MKTEIQQELLDQISLASPYEHLSHGLRSQLEQCEESVRSKLCTDVHKGSVDLLSHFTKMKCDSWT